MAVSVFGWIVRGGVAVVSMVLIYVIVAGLLAKFKIEPDDEPDVANVVPVNERFLCIVCGAEVVMTAAQPDEELTAPRHCREDMVRVSEVSE